MKTFESVLEKIQATQFLEAFKKHKEEYIASLRAFTEDQKQFLLYTIARKYKQKSAEVFQALKALPREVISFEMKQVFESIPQAYSAQKEKISFMGDMCEISARSALHHAIEKKSDIETIEILIQNGSSVHYQIILQRPNFRVEALTPLEYAILLNQELLVDALIRLNSDVNKGDGFNFPLLRACHANSPSMIQKLIAAGADVNQLSGRYSSHPFIADEPIDNCRQSSLTSLLAVGKSHPYTRGIYDDQRDFSPAIATLLSFGHPTLDLAHDIIQDSWNLVDHLDYVPPPTERHIMPLDLVQYTDKLMAEKRHLRIYKSLVENAIARVISNRIVGIDQLLSLVTGPNSPLITPLRKVILSFVGVDEELTQFAGNDSSISRPSGIGGRVPSPIPALPRAPTDPAEIDVTDMETVLLSEFTAASAAPQAEKDSKSSEENHKIKVAVIYCNPAQKFIAETFQSLMDAKNEGERALLAASTSEWNQAGILMFSPSRPPRAKWFPLANTAAPNTVVVGMPIASKVVYGENSAKAAAAAVGSAEGVTVAEGKMDLNTQASTLCNKDDKDKPLNDTDAFVYKL